MIPARLRHCFGPLSLVLLALALGAFAPPAEAQSAASVISEMKTRYLEQFNAVDTYVIETDLYTSYHKKVNGGDPPEFRTTTKLKGQNQMFSNMGSVTQGQFDQFDKLAQHGRHTGMETVDGTSCHVITADDPSKIDPSLGQEAQSLTYYISADDYLPRRMEFTMKPRGDGSAPQVVTVTLKNYKTVEGLSLPWTMEMQTNMNETMSPEEKQRLQEMRKQMEQMDEKQREMMKDMMGDQMKQLEKMMSGEPTVVQVQRVTVNEPLPDGVFQN